MKKYIFILLIIIVSASTINAQKNSMKIDFSYLITTEPVFKAGFEHRSDTLSNFSYGMNLEFGRYIVNTQSVSSSYIDDYQMKGFGIMPIARYYSPKGKNSFYGIFVEGFVLLRKVSEVSLTNIQVDNQGYDLSNSLKSSRKGMAYNYGLAIGYRFGRPAGIVHFETLVGYGAGNNTLTNNESVLQYSSRDILSKDDMLRFELNLVATFK